MQKVLTPQQHDILQAERNLFTRLEGIAVRLESAAQDRTVLAQTRQQLDEFFLLVVVGEFNSGKSAFINAMLGERFLDEGVTPTTSQVYVLGYGPQPAAEQVEPFLLRVSYPVPWLQEINIVDTPGTNAVILRHQQITEAFVPRSDLILFVTSADRPFSESERGFLELVSDWGKKVVVVINKIDILENEASLNQVVAFVRDQAAAVLGSVPRIFPVSVRMAQRGKQMGEDNGSDPADAAAQLEASRFPALESFILHTLDQQQRLMLKLASPLGVADNLHRDYKALVLKRLGLLESDFKTLSDIDSQLDGYVDDMRHDFQFRISRIDNILYDVRARGDSFFEETIRMGRFFDLINSSRLRSEFEREVIGDTHERIEHEVNELIDWMIERNYRQWQEITQHLGRRAAQHGERIVGEIGGSFDLNRKQLLQSVGRSVREAVATYDHQAEARHLSESVRLSLTAMGAAEVGALGVGAVLLAILSRALDPLGLLAAGGIAIAGLFVLPARRRAAKNDLDAKIEAVRVRLKETLGVQFERELQQSVQEIREAVGPYTRFIRVEHEKLAQLDRELDGVALEVRQLRSQLHALDPNASQDGPPA